MNRLHATFAFERLGWTRCKGSKSKPDDSSFARREEEKWDAEYSVPPGDGLETFGPSVTYHAQCFMAPNNHCWPLLGGMLSPTSLIISAVLMLERLGRTRRC
jgi:hypothetical protein